MDLNNSTFIFGTITAGVILLAVSFVVFKKMGSGNSNASKEKKFVVCI
jgi:hypothetical protein